MIHAVHVRAPCRLHFGMFSFGHDDQPQFGGVGLMIDPPAAEVRITPSKRFHASGSLADRVEHFAKEVVRHWHLNGLPACTIHAQSPRDHIGLGVGTQLALSVAAGMRRFLDLPDMPAATLAADVRRGVRSAVGTHGFQHGGLIVDAGHTRDQTIGRLAYRVPIPSDWRAVLLLPTDQRGLSGANEADAFARLPPVPNDVTRQLWQITEQELLPALQQADCRAFGEAAFRFGRHAGECFAAVQGGPFFNPVIARLVDIIRDFGITGVGQSSWGPTVFAICATQRDADDLIGALSSRSEFSKCETHIAQPCNSGAQIEVCVK